jgi:hypothetical protein
VRTRREAIVRRIEVSFGLNGFATIVITFPVAWNPGE